jgi:hypothetical protein
MRVFREFMIDCQIRVRLLLESGPPFKERSIDSKTQSDAVTK